MCRSSWFSGKQLLTKLSFAKFVACFNFKIASKILWGSVNVVCVSNSEDPNETLSYLVYHLDRSCLNSCNKQKKGISKYISQWIYFLLNSSHIQYFNTNRFTPNMEKQFDEFQTALVSDEIQNYFWFGLYPIYFIVFLSLSFIYEILWSAAIKFRCLYLSLKLQINFLNCWPSVIYWPVCILRFTSNL